MDGQILSMKFAAYRKAGRRSGNPVFVKTRFPDPPVKTFIWLAVRPERCGYRDIGLYPGLSVSRCMLALRRVVPPLRQVPRSARDYMASGGSRLACNSSAVILSTQEADVVKSGRDSPICLQASLFLPPVAAGVPAGRYQPEATKACSEPSQGAARLLII